MRVRFLPAMLALLSLCVPVSAAPPDPSAHPAAVASSALGLASWAASDLGGLEPSVFALAAEAASCAVDSGDTPAPDTLTIIDYSRPSTEKRLWVYDLTTHSLAFQELVAHGQGTGANMATTFSNAPDSHQSSLGLFATSDTYEGKNGYSLRLDGLEPGINDRARERAIVIHGAPYVTASFAATQGRLGRSWGCPAVSLDIARALIDRVKGRGLVFAYYPDRRWLSSSKYLNCGH